MKLEWPLGSHLIQLPAQTGPNVKFDHVGQSTVQPSSEYLQGQRYHNLSGLFQCLIIFIVMNFHFISLEYPSFHNIHVVPYLAFHSTALRRVWLSSL